MNTTEGISFTPQAIDRFDREKEWCVHGVLITKRAERPQFQNVISGFEESVELGPLSQVKIFENAQRSARMLVDIPEAITGPD